MSFDLADNSALICHGCLGESWLKSRVRNQGGSGTCHFCGARNKCVTINTLCAWLRAILDNHFRICHAWTCHGHDGQASEYREQGENLEHLVFELLEADVPVVDAVLDELTLLPLFGPETSAFPVYAREASYAPCLRGVATPAGGWQAFCEELLNRPRLSNSLAKRYLDPLLKDGQSMRESGKRGNAVVRAIKPGETVIVYRARSADTPRKLEQLLANFRNELGPPPPEKAPAGRANREGIPVFQGSFDRETCVAELCPDQGDTLVSGAFRLVKPIRLLDLCLLERCHKEQPLSYFQPDFMEKAVRRFFFNRLHTKIRRHASHGGEAEFLPTQIFAEYLCGMAKPRLDGVIYASARRAGGLNLLLFNHALDIRAIEGDGDIMGPEAVIRPVDQSARVHKVSGIEYRTVVSHEENHATALSLNLIDYPSDGES